MQVIERTEGHYDVEEVEFGTLYRWCPECVVVACDCGERLTLTRSETTCERCGVDHATSVRRELAACQPREEIVHPWRYGGDRQGGEVPCASASRTLGLAPLYYPGTPRSSNNSSWDPLS
jgi:hypothetical protein